MQVNTAAITTYFNYNFVFCYTSLQLIPSAQPLPANANGYFFYFSLLGNDVTNETFQDMINPNFPAERASVRIQSSIEVLRLFFSHQPGVQVGLRL